VTIADREVQDFLKHELASGYPAVSFVGEEGEPELLTTPDYFVVDPIDGTTNFVHGLPFYTVSIAYIVDRSPSAGVVYVPELDLLYAAATGQGATCNGKEIHVSGANQLSSSLLATGFVNIRKGGQPDNLAEFCRLMPRCRGIRRLGSASLDLCFVANGSFDGFWEFGLSDWDVAAGALIVQEAGGRVTAMDGTSSFMGSGEILATNGHLHNTLVEELRAVR